MGGFFCLGTMNRARHPSEDKCGAATGCRGERKGFFTRRTGFRMTSVGEDRVQNDTLRRGQGFRTPSEDSRFRNDALRRGQSAHRRREETMSGFGGHRDGEQGFRITHLRGLGGFPE